jgi:hypothetical protein
MARFRWIRYFRIKPGAPTGFANGKFPAGVDLTNPELPIETVKKIYEMGVPFIEPTEMGINKFYPHLKPKEPKPKTKSRKSKTSDG